MTASPPLEQYLSEELEPDPLGAITLPQQIAITDMALRTMERMRYGNAFIPPGSAKKTLCHQADLRARMTLVLEVNPQLEAMYAQHDQLMQQYLEGEKIEADVSDVQRQCRQLADQIVELEESVDLG